MSTGWIKQGRYEASIVDGHEQYYLYTKNQRKLLRIVKSLQAMLWLFGIAVHDPLFGECTSDFNCCNKGLGRGALIRISAKDWNKNGR